MYKSKPINQIAVVYDMDGLLVNTESLWQISMKKEFHTVGITLDESQCRLTAGMKMKDVVSLWYSKKPWSTRSTEDLTESIINGTIDLIKQKVKLKTGVLNSLQYLKANNIKIGLASGSDHKVISTVLSTTLTREYFDVICSSEDEINGKPHPDVYIRALDRLNADPSLSFAIEDSFNGLRAAKSANMNTVYVPDSISETKSLEIADIYIETLDEFRIHFENFLELNHNP